MLLIVMGLGLYMAQRSNVVADEVYLVDIKIFDNEFGTVSEGYIKYKSPRFLGLKTWLTRQLFEINMNGDDFDLDYIEEFSCPPPGGCNLKKYSFIGFQYRDNRNKNNE